MIKGIGKIVLFFFQVGLFLFFPMFANAQFYVGGKYCIENTTAGTTPPNGGASITKNCSSPTVFFDTDLTTTSSYWDFGDGTTSNIRNPTHQYQTAGTYNVSLTRTKSNSVFFPVTKSITIGTYPDQPLFKKKESADTTICDGKTIKLDPYHLRPAPTGVSYLWSPNGETSPTINVNKPGCYSVEVFNTATGCSRTAKMNVKVCLQTPPSTSDSEKWYFGNGATLDFAFGGTPVVEDPLASNGNLFETQQYDNITYSPAVATVSNPVNTKQGVAMVFDPTSSLKYYTDGKTVWDGQNTVVPIVSGASVINPNNNTSQGTLIVPKNACNECPHHQYYVFNVDASTKILSYSIIDTRLNNGKGAITELNVPLFYPATERINAVMTKDERGFMIIAHEAGTNNFNIITLDSTGIRQSPQAIGGVQDTPESQRGYVAVSPVRDKIAQGVVLNGKNYVEIYDIDNATGKLSNLRQVDLGIAAPPEVYGLAFNDHADLLYVTIKGNPALSQSSYIYQLNLNLPNAADIASTKQLLDKNSNVSYGAIQEGPVTATNGKKYMYVAVENSTKLAYIQEPNIIGDGNLTGFVKVSAINGAKLNGTSQWGLPTIVLAKTKDDGEDVSATYSGNCQFSPTVLEMQAVCSPMKNKVEWKIDGGAVKLNGSQVAYTFTKEGWHTIEATITIMSDPPTKNFLNSQIINSLLSTQCTQKTITDNIFIKPAPQANLPSSVTACYKEGDKLSLNPVVSGGTTFSYLWLPMGITTKKIELAASGNISFEASNEYNCKLKKNITNVDACEPRITVPEAFSPNGDGLNDDLEISYAHIKDFHLMIFNRWGDMVFESNAPEKKWAGTINGTPAMAGVYPYTIEYKSTDFPNREAYTMRGFVIVLK